MARMYRDAGAAGRSGRLAAGGLLLVPLLGVVIVLLIYVTPGGKSGKSYIETVVDSKKQAVVAVVATELHGLYREFEMAAVMNDGNYPPLQELLETSAIAHKLLRRPGRAGDQPCVYIEGQNERMPPDNVLVYEASAMETGAKGMVVFRDGQVETRSAAEMEAAVAETHRRLQGM